MAMRKGMILTVLAWAAVMAMLWALPRSYYIELLKDVTAVDRGDGDVRMAAGPLGYGGVNPDPDSREVEVYAPWPGEPLKVLVKSKGGSVTYVYFPPEKTLYIRTSTTWENFAKSRA